MGLPDGSCYLSPNNFHKVGDKLPCLTAKKILILGVEFKVAIWAPKPGKNAYYMRIQELDEDHKEASEPEKQEPSKPISRTLPQTNDPASLFK